MKEIVDDYARDKALRHPEGPRDEVPAGWWILPCALVSGLTGLVMALIF